MWKLVSQMNSNKTLRRASEFHADYTIGRKTISDLTRAEPLNTHVRLRVYGGPAREIYDLIDAAPIM